MLCKVQSGTIYCTGPCVGVRLYFWRIRLFGYSIPIKGIRNTYIGNHSGTVVELVNIMGTPKKTFPQLNSEPLKVLLATSGVFKRELVQQPFSIDIVLWRSCSDVPQ